MSTTLDELRKLNIAQQKQDNISARTDATEEKQPNSLSDASVPHTEEGTSASPQARKSASTQGNTSALEAEEGKHSRSSTTRKPGSRVRRATVADEGEFLERVQERIACKRTHSGGVKASVDLEPELSLRAKRYCLEHGNMPLRILFIELLSAFLEEEGY